jgi:hypothetical protein
VWARSSYFVFCFCLFLLSPNRLLLQIMPFLTDVRNMAYIHTQTHIPPFPLLWLIEEAYPSVCSFQLSFWPLGSTLQLIHIHPYPMHIMYMWYCCMTVCYLVK